MSSADGTGKLGPGAISAAKKAVGGAGNLPDPPPRPGALHASTLAAQSVTATLAANGSPRPAAPLLPLGDETVKAKVARAGLRQLKRAFPTLGPISTLAGNATAYNLFEKNTQGQKVAYIRTAADDFPGTTEPKEYADIAKDITPTAAAAVLGNAPLSAEESVKARRAATTAKGLEVVSEQQRNGGGKHARAALRTIAGQHLTPKATYAGETPAFAQAKTVQYHRDVISGASPVTPGFKTVVENFSDSSDDESVAALLPIDAIHRYRLFTETKAVRERLAADAGGGKETAKPSAASSLPVHGPRTAGEDSHQTPARPSRKHAAPEETDKELDSERISKRPRTRAFVRREIEAATAEEDNHPTDAGTTRKRSAEGEKELDRNRESKRRRR